MRACESDHRVTHIWGAPQVPLTGRFKMSLQTINTSISHVLGRTGNTQLIIRKHTSYTCQRMKIVLLQSCLKLPRCVKHRNRRSAKNANRNEETHGRYFFGTVDIPRRGATSCLRINVLLPLLRQWPRPSCYPAFPFESPLHPPCECQTATTTITTTT